VRIWSDTVVCTCHPGRLIIFNLHKQGSLPSGDLHVALGSIIRKQLRSSQVN